LVCSEWSEEEEGMLLYLLGELIEVAQYRLVSTHAFSDRPKIILAISENLNILKIHL
jgi:hypothetical protein